MNKSTYILIVFLSGIILSSCKIGHKFQQPELNLPPTFEGAVSEDSVAADIGWSTLYKDTMLQQLIDKALVNNKDMLTAESRIREMMYAQRIARAALFPWIGVEAFDQKEVTNYGGENKKETPKIRAGFTAAWEIDIWGKLRWQNESAKAAFLQTTEAQRALHLSIVAQVAQTYFELKTLDRELTIVRKTLEARREGAQFAKLRYEGGLTSEIPYRQSLVEQARTETLVPNLENQIKAKENDLWVLTGEYPSGAIPRGDDFKNDPMPESLPVDLPSSLLKRRPDVSMAEQQLIQANAQAGVAFTEMFPSVAITGRYGVENSDFTDFLKSPAWFAAAALAGPVFQAGKNKAQYKAAQEVYEQELYHYQQTILNVFKEVNNAVVAFDKMREVKHSHDVLYRSAHTYHELAQLQYVNGVISYIDVLDSQRQLFDAEIALNSAILDEMLSVVNLYKALGGGTKR